MNSNGENCETCRFYFKLFDEEYRPYEESGVELDERLPGYPLYRIGEFVVDNDLGYCRRHAPISARPPVSPLVGCAWWCGDYQEG
jgi:hypothetical protein